MKNHKRFAVKVLGFLIVLVLVLYFTNAILMPKYLSDSTVWETSSTYAGFYAMEKNTIDVLFLGSSHTATAFSPQLLYNSYGIKSYNLGCEQQNLIMSYYWLKEALRYQKPKAVVLDVRMLYTLYPYNSFNTDEVYIWKALDNMKWSGNKLEAVIDLTNLDENQSFTSYMFPFVRYHTRWENLQESDFRYKYIENLYELKGYCPLNDVFASQNYEPFSIDESTERVEILPLMQKYLDKIIQVCDERGISLILVKTPALYFNDSAHYYTMLEYANEHNKAYYDFNEETLYNKCNFNYGWDMSDDDHPKVWGAEKISSFIGEELVSRFGLSNEDLNGSEQWKRSDAAYQEIIEDCRLKDIYDINEYIDAINRDRYTVLMAVQKDAGYLAVEENGDCFEKLGLDFQVDYGKSYYAVINEGKIIEQVSDNALDYHGCTRGRLVDFEIFSEGVLAGDSKSVIKLDDVDYTSDYRESGLLIVVYSRDRLKVVDTILFNENIIRR